MGLSDRPKHCRYTEERREETQMGGRHKVNQSYGKRDIKDIVKWNWEEGGSGTEDTCEGFIYVQIAWRKRQFYIYFLHKAFVTLIPLQI